MGHRHLFGTSQMFEGDNEQSWNTMHVEQPFGHLVRGSAVDNGGFFYPMENMPADGPPFTYWEPAPRSNGYVPLAHNGELSHHQQDAPGLSQDSYTHPSNIGTYSAFPENYAHHASSSSYDTQIYYGGDGNSIDMMIDNGRGQHKRKSPGIPAVSERGSSSRYHGGGNASSSDIPASSELRLEKSPIDSACMPWDSIDSAPDYRSNNHPMRGESSLRNVRSRSGADLEPNIVRNYMSTNPPLNTYSTNHPMEHPSQMDHPGEISSTMPREWSLANLSSGHGRVPVSDAGGYNHESNHFPSGSSNANAPPVENVAYDFVSNRNSLVPQGFHGSSSQHSIRHARGAYSQRSNLTFRSSGNGIRMGNMGPSDERLRSATASFSRHTRPLASMGWRNNERNRRSRISHERYRPFPDDAGGHGQLAYEGLVIMDRPALYASRSGFDQHRDLRLDIDNMSYEELLALGERIGNVNTGLSEDSISKCLKETIRCSLDQIQEEEKCAICLEEYEDMEDVGSLKSCGHDYHVSCIKKWLSMKNLCPICKSPALEDNVKQQ